MPTENKNLEALYQEKLKPQLLGMEKERKSIKNRLIFVSFIAIIAFAFLPFIRNEVLVWVYAVVVVLTLAVFAVPALIKYIVYRHTYKKTVVNEIIKLINPDFQYDTYYNISIADFNAAKLFNKGERCTGDDFVQGEIEKTPFQYSEVKVGNSAQNNTNSKQTYFFRGLFFFADFNKEIQGQTYVFPDKAEKCLGKIGQSLQSGSSKGELVKLENAEFEKTFVVYSSSQVEARYILTPKMMEAMVNIYQKYKLDFYFSFVGSRVNCAVRFNHNLFEPVIFGEGLKFKDIEYIYMLFSLIETIIHEMNLNTRIWTKT